MFAPLRRGRQLQLPVDIMMHLFDTLIWYSYMVVKFVPMKEQKLFKNSI